MLKKTLSLLLLLALISASWGCAFTRMETARQLESNDILLAGNLDWPGALYLPRAGFYAMYGVGGVGDISVHAGTSLLTFNAGAGTRAYLGEQAILSLQGEFMLPLINDGLFVSDGGLLILTPRVMSSAMENRIFYAGFQSNIISGFDGNNIELGGALLGGFGGIDYWDSRTGFGFQAETIVLPLSADASGLHIAGDGDDIGLIGFFQFSAGVYFRTPQKAEPERQIPPSPYYEYEYEDERPSRERPPRPTTPRPQPEPEPEYDDQGVPLY